MVRFIQLSRCRNTHRLSVAYLFVRDVRTIEGERESKGNFIHRRY
jgi:hypothetical protein